MSLFSAFGKYVLRKVDDAITENQTQKAKKTAYKKTGEKIDEAKRTNQYVNGKAMYYAQLNEQMKKVNKAHEERSLFINDIWNHN